METVRDSNQAEWGIVDRDSARLVRRGLSSEHGALNAGLEHFHGIGDTVELGEPDHDSELGVVCTIHALFGSSEGADHLIVGEVVDLAIWKELL